MVGLLILGSFIIYKIFIAFHFEYFPNGKSELYPYNITVQMIKDYGNEIDENELEDLKEIYNNKLKEADEFLSENKDFNEVGIYSYEEYLGMFKKSFDNRDEEFEKVKWDYFDREESDIFLELGELGYIIGWYEQKEDYYSEDRYEEKYEERINEINSNNEEASILPSLVFNNYNTLIVYVGALIIIGITFMLTPIFLKDKKDKVDHLQYCSKEGRKIFKSKLIAGLISALLIITIEIIISLILYKGQKTSMFFESDITSILNLTFWFDLTFIQYIIITIISIYIIGIITAFISMFISNKANSYIASIGIQVPTLFAIIGLTTSCLLNNLFVLYIPKYLSLVIYLVLIGITVIITMRAIKKEKIIDIY